MAFMLKTNCMLPKLVCFLAVFSFPVNCFSQKCEGFEQSAFEYFINVLVKEEESPRFNGKKFVFFDTIQNTYSRFRAENASSSSEKDLKIDRVILTGVAQAASSAEKNFKNESFCKRISMANIKSRFKHRMTRKRILLKVYKATKVGDTHYVQIRCMDRDGEADYLIGLSLSKTITKWFMQHVYY
jgi:hypothetical protein